MYHRNVVLVSTIMVVWCRTPPRWMLFLFTSGDTMLLETNTACQSLPLALSFPPSLSSPFPFFPSHLCYLVILEGIDLEWLCQDVNNQTQYGLLPACTAMSRDSHMIRASFAGFWLIISLSLRQPSISKSVPRE